MGQPNIYVVTLQICIYIYNESSLNEPYKIALCDSSAPKLLNKYKERNNTCEYVKFMALFIENNVLLLAERCQL